MDAICAVKILQCILRFDNIIYVLVPVKTITEFKKAFEEQKVDVCLIINNFLKKCLYLFKSSNFISGKICNINQLWWYIRYNRNIGTRRRYYLFCS